MGSTATRWWQRWDKLSFPPVLRHPAKPNFIPECLDASDLKWRKSRTGDKLFIPAVRLSAWICGSLYVHFTNIPMS